MLLIILPRIEKKDKNTLLHLKNLLILFENKNANLYSIYIHILWSDVLRISTGLKVSLMLSLLNR